LEAIQKSGISLDTLLNFAGVCVKDVRGQLEVESDEAVAEREAFKASEVGLRRLGWVSLIGLSLICEERFIWVGESQDIYAAT
jgi:hypothetical protein